MKRRDFLRTTGIISAGLAFPNAKTLFAVDSAPEGWRTFEVSTRVEVLKSSGTTRIWVPAAIARPTPFPENSLEYFQRRRWHRQDWSKAMLRMV